MWLWWYFGRAARAGKVFLEEEKRREVGRARNIVEWFEMALIAIAANTEHLPFLFAWTCSKKARGTYYLRSNEETSVASSGANDTGIVYSASNTSTNTRREPMFKHFCLSCLLRSRHALSKRGRGTGWMAAILPPNLNKTTDGTVSIVECVESSCLIIKVAVEWQILTAVTATMIVRAQVEELE